MKAIKIGETEYNIDCNALTYVKYKTFFRTGILKDMQFIQTYLIKQTVIANQVDDKMSDAEKVSTVSECMIDDTDEFITKITQLAWILIYTADNKVVDYESWLKSITNFKIDDDWIVEVTEFAVDCFCR